MALRFQGKMSQDVSEKKEEHLWYQRYSLAIEILNWVLWVEKNLKELEFFIVVYGKNETELIKNVKDMKYYGGRQFNLQDII